jgi:hypothetical protein
MMSIGPNRNGFGNGASGDGNSRVLGSYEALPGNDIETGSPISPIRQISAEESALSSSSEFCCRICLDTGPRSDFIAPCSCRGTSKWVHRSCLDKWRSVREDRAFSKCTECLVAYKLKPLHDDSDSNTCYLHSKFYCLVLRDIFLAIAVWQAAVCVLGLLVFMLDLKSSLIQQFDMENKVLVSTLWKI